MAEGAGVALVLLLFLGVPFGVGFLIGSWWRGRRVRPAAGSEDTRPAAGSEHQSAPRTVELTLASVDKTNKTLVFKRDGGLTVRAARSHFAFEGEPVIGARIGFVELLGENALRLGAGRVYRATAVDSKSKAKLAAEIDRLTAQLQVLEAQRLAKMTREDGA